MNSAGRNKTHTSQGETCAQVLVRALDAQGVDRVFCVPGESYLAVLDAFYDTPGIQVITARHEGAAANMAEADGKLTQRPGVCFVTRGPGATHASIGVHTACQDSTPLVLFIGQVALAHREREGFQEVDYRAMFRPICKWVTEIEDPDRAPEIVSRAFHVATSGRPGPVVVALPEDILRRTCTVAPTAGAVAGRAAPEAGALDTLSAELEKAEQPLLVVGGSGWTQKAVTSLADFVEAWSLPTLAGFRRQDLIDNNNTHYVGHAGLGIDPKLAERIRNADLIVAAGTRLGENTTSGYSLVSSPQPKQRLIHVHPDPEELGRVYRPDLAIPANLTAFAAALDGVRPKQAPSWREWLKAARDDFLAFTDPSSVRPVTSAVDLTKVVATLNERLGPDAIIANGAGNYTVWVHRFFRYRHPGTELAPTSGAMGYGLPAAIAAKLRHPERDVICFAGDGCFMMYPQELATAVQNGVNVIVILVNNGMYGTIRMHQERSFPGRVIGTDLQNPDFVALAQSFGVHAESVRETTEFEAAFERARDAGRPALIELQVDPQQITPTLRLQ